MKKILFICAQNAGRSQMAAGFFNALERTQTWHADSAGTVPATHVHDTVNVVMEEIGISLEQAVPTLFNASTVYDYEKIISFGCVVKEFFDEPIQARIEEWSIDDPQGKDVSEVRKIRDAIRTRVIDLISQLKNTVAK